MNKEKISQKFRQKDIDETRNYFLEELKQTELMRRKYKKFCASPNCIEHFLILASAVTGHISITAFASLVGIPIEVTTSGIGLKIWTITAGIKKYKSTIKKTKKKHDKIVMFSKPQLNSIEVLNSKALIDSVISYDKFVLIDNLLTEYGETKEEIKNLKN